MALADKGHEVHFITYNQPVRLDFLSHNLHFHQVVIEEYPLFESETRLKTLTVFHLQSKIARFFNVKNLDGKASFKYSIFEA